MGKAIFWGLSTPLLIAIGFSTATWAQVPEATDKDRWISRLKARESQFRTVYCEFECIYQPTSPELEKLIRERFKAVPEQMEGCILSAQNAKISSYIAKLWRKGDKERLEKTQIEPSPHMPPKQLEAFDGQHLTWVLHERNGVSGGKALAKERYWHTTMRDHPISDVYYYYDKLYSEMIAESKAIAAKSIVFDVARCSQLTIDCGPARHGGARVELVFDGRERLLQMINGTPADAPERGMIEHLKFAFLDYFEAQTPSGMKVWFPRRIEQIQLDGRLPNGTLVEIFRSTLRVRNLKFDIDMPDNLFELAIPR